MYGFSAVVAKNEFFACTWLVALLLTALFDAYWNALPKLVLLLMQ